MNKSKEFEKWLIENKRLSQSSAYKYSRAIETVSKDMMNIGILNKNLYFINSLYDLGAEISKIKSNSTFKSKNTTGHNMYSVALDHFHDYIRYQTK